MDFLKNNWFKLVIAVSAVIVSFSIFYNLVASPFSENGKVTQIDRCIVELEKDPSSIPNNEYDYDYRQKCADLLDSKGIDY